MSTPGMGYGVTKGSYLVIGIPKDFDIYDINKAQSSCLKIEGFSDEVTCSLQIDQSILSTGHH